MVACNGFACVIFISCLLQSVEAFVFQHSSLFSSRSNLMRKSDTFQMASKYLGEKPVFIAGGSSGVGLEVIKLLSKMGTPVKVLVRREDAIPMLKAMPGVEVQLGDALDEAKVQECMNGCVAAVTTLGGAPAEGTATRVDYLGNSNVIEQAGILGVERVILVTSVGCGPTVDAIPVDVYRLLKDALDAKTKAEKELKTYTLSDWTILRPGGLKSDSPTGKAIFTKDKLASGSVDRADVAELIVQCLGTEGIFTRRELTIIDPTISDKDYKYEPFNINNAD